MHSKFRGHSGPIVDMGLCPSEDLFLTASQDRTVRLWNLGSAGCVGKMELSTAQTQGSPRVAFDSTGMVFCVMAQMASDGYYLHLYDARNFSGGAFSELQVTHQSLKDAMVTHRVVSMAPAQAPQLDTISFNGSGNRLLAHADSTAFVLDGYEGTVQLVLQSRKGHATCSCFTPDDASVLLGSDAGTVECFDLQSGQSVRQLEGGHASVSAVACNPKHKQVASAGADTCLWIW